MEGYTRTTGGPLFWITYGNDAASPLLVLHGGPGAHHDYLLPGMLALSDEHRMVFYDQRGGGRSRTDDARDPITVSTHLDDLQALIAELHLEPLSLVGYSFGGLLALHYAIEAFEGRRSPKPVRLVLIDPAPVTRQFRSAFEAEFARRQSGKALQALRAELAESGLRERDPEAYRRRQFDLSVAGYFADPRRARELTPFRVIGRVQQSVWDSLGDYDLTARLRAIACPTLIVHGREDPIPLASSEAIAAAIPGARLAVIEDAGHVPYVEQPEALFAEIRSFLGETEPA